MWFSVFQILTLTFKSVVLKEKIHNDHIQFKISWCEYSKITGCIRKHLEDAECFRVWRENSWWFHSRITDLSCHTICIILINFKFASNFICSCVSDRISLRDAPFCSCKLCTFNVISWWLPLEEEFHVTDKCSKDGCCNMYVNIVPDDAEVGNSGYFITTKTGVYASHVILLW